MTTTSAHAGFNIVEASISDHRKALDAREITSVDLVISYLNRIATYDSCAGLNAFTVFNHTVLKDAVASDARRAQGLPARPLEGIPYTIKDSYKVAGLSVTNGSPALKGLMSSEDSAIAQKLRDAGAVLIGKTNMPPMAAGGMQRGMYGRAESPYNAKYLTGAFSSGSSNGAATSIASSMAVFGMGSETVSSGRSPASNNALVCYTPSKGILSCRGLWPLYITCDVPTPYARSVVDMLEILDVIATPDEKTEGDFIRSQTHVPIPAPPQINYKSLRNKEALKGKRIGVPKLYVGQQDSDPQAKPTYVSPEVLEIWSQTASDLELLGAKIVYTDFPLITNYENDSVSGEANNVDGRPGNWNLSERGILIALAWNEFLVQNKDPAITCLADIEDSGMLFPKPEDYLPDTFLEARNWIDYSGLPKLLDKTRDTLIKDFPGLEQALKALEAQRKRDLEDWMDRNGFDVIAFPAQGDVGIADLEFNLESTTHSLRNGVRYSNGNRAIRHLGIPTVSVPMGIMSERRMPVNLTFVGQAYEDTKLLEFAYAYEHATNKRSVPAETPALSTDIVSPKVSGSIGNITRRLNLSATVLSTAQSDGSLSLRFHGTISVDFEDTTLQIFIDGQEAYHELVRTERWVLQLKFMTKRTECLGWDLKPLETKDIMIVVVARGSNVTVEAEVLWVPVVTSKEN